VSFRELIDLMGRSEDRRGRYGGPPWRIVLRHLDMELDAMGTPDA
jgi:hypothetical protein